MSGTATRGEKIKAAFGKVFPNVVADKKAEVGALIGRLATEMSSLPATTSSLVMAYHPGAKDVAKEYETLHARLDKVTGTDKAAYDACVAIENQAKAALKAVPALKEAVTAGTALAGKPGDQIDRVVGEIGSKASSNKERGTVIAAIKERYGLDKLGGELTSNALPRLYKVLGMVPANHTKDNPMFQTLTRSKMSDTSLYFNGQGALKINGGEAGPFSSEREKYTDGAGTKLEFNKFDAHTLHEVGHSVDDASGYMAKHRSETTHGGWRETTEDEVHAAKAKQLKGSHTELSLQFLIEAVSEGLRSGKIDTTVAQWSGRKGVFDLMTADGLRQDPAIDAMEKKLAPIRGQLTVPLSMNDMTTVLQVFGSSVGEALRPSPVRDPQQQMLMMHILKPMRDLAMSADDAIDGMQAAIEAASDQKAVQALQKEITAWGDTVKKELWWNSAAVPKVEIDGRVYQQDGKKWWSYASAARANMVKDYQFRSPAEWFAEVYTVAMLGKLAASHPCAADIKLIDTTTKLT